MNVNKYVNKIVRKIKCSDSRKREIKKDLLTDINSRLEQGERPEDILSQMGSITEIAESFNENISPQEKKSYTRKKVFRILITVAVLLIFAGALLYWMLPKADEINHYFSQTEVENKVTSVIELLDNNDYSSLCEIADEQIRSSLNTETMSAAKAQLSDNWGNRLSVGTIYTSEITQQGKHFAVSQVTVGYENVSVTYTLTFDQDLNLVGLYMK